MKTQEETVFSMTNKKIEEEIAYVEKQIQDSFSDIEKKELNRKLRYLKNEYLNRQYEI